MFKTLKFMMMIAGLTATFAAASVAQAETPSAAPNNMTTGNAPEMSGMMGGHDKAGSMGGGNMMGMMAMMTTCMNMMAAQTNMMAAQTNMMNAMTSELNARANALAHGATAAPK
jgi:hypothetical protein